VSQVTSRKWINKQHENSTVSNDRAKVMSLLVVSSCDSCWCWSPADCKLHGVLVPMPLSLACSGLSKRGQIARTPAPAPLSTRVLTDLTLFSPSHRFHLAFSFQTSKTIDACVPPTFGCTKMSSVPKRQPFHAQQNLPAGAVTASPTTNSTVAEWKSLAK
jgi:hypothetical protein